MHFLFNLLSYMSPPLDFILGKGNQPGEDDFLLLNGSNFLLLNGSNFILLN